MNDHRWSDDQVSGLSDEAREAFLAWWATLPADVVESAANGMEWQALIAATWREAADGARTLRVMALHPLTGYGRVEASMEPAVAEAYGNWWRALARVSHSNWAALVVEAWAHGTASRATKHPQREAHEKAHAAMAPQRKWRLGAGGIGAPTVEQKGGEFDEVVVGQWLHIEMMNGPQKNDALDEPAEAVDSYFMMFGGLAFWFTVDADGNVNIASAEDRSGYGDRHPYPRTTGAQALADAQHVDDADIPNDGAER
jgi:hypothetical protein